MNFLKAKSIDATTGKLLPKIFAYALPLIISTIIQQLFNAIDIVVLGNMADSIAVASVGATSSIVALLVNSFVGLASGLRVVLARQVGAKDEQGIRKSTDTGLILAIVLGIALAVIGFVFTPWFLDITNCPKECYDGAMIYVMIYVGGAPIILLYNFAAAVLNASGDTQRPLYYIMIGGVTNLVLNIILCLILPRKVIAVAVATVVSQLVAAFLASKRLLSMEGTCRVIVSKMKFDFGALGKILRFGLPMAFTSALFPISNLQIQSAINSFGVSATAGNSAASTIENVLSSTAGPFGTTAATFIGQNIGANKPDRVKKSFYSCLLWSTLIGGIAGTLIFLSGKVWLGIIVGADTAAITFGLIRMSCTTLFYAVACINTIYANALQAHGYSTFSAINSIFCVFIFRIIWMQGLYPMLDGYPDNNRFFFITVCFLVSWVLRMFVNIVIFAIVRVKYKCGIKKVM